MAAVLYVPTDSDGVEHGPGGRVRWNLPDDGPGETTAKGPVLLYEPGALLDSLDERIYRAEPIGEVRLREGIVTAEAGRLLSLTGWDTAAAASFALDCADHVLNDAGDHTLPDGPSFADVIAQARRALTGTTAADETAHLGYLARLGVLRRLRRERVELGDVATGVVTEDIGRHLDALDDPDYQELAPLIDALLAAIEALRHHVMPRLLGELEASAEERGEHKLLDRQTVVRAPTVLESPWGPIEVGGAASLAYEPAWTSARECARHARTVASSRQGSDGGEQERTWQSARLSKILEG